VRSLYAIGVAAALGLAGVLPARAALYEGFDYPPSVQLAGQTNPQTGQPWTYVGTAAANSADLTTSSDNLTYAGFPDATGSSVITNRTQTGVSRLPLPAAVNSGTVYYSMLLRVNDMAGLTNTTTGSFFAGLHNSNTAGQPSITVSGAPLLIHLDPTNPNAYNLGVGVSTNNADRVFSTVQHALGETVLVVGSYEFVPGADNDVARLWINPASTSFGAETPPDPPTVISDGVTSAGVASDIAQLVSFYLRNNGVEPQTIQVDELRVDTTWAGVTTIPEPSAMLLVMVVLGGLARRRRSS